MFIDFFYFQDVTHDDDDDEDSNIFLSTDEAEQMPDQPTVETPMSPLSAAVMQAVDPCVVSPAITVTGAASSHNSLINSSSRSQPGPTIKMESNNSLNDKSYLSLSTAMMTPTRRPLLQREISKEDFDLETTMMQKDLDNLKEMLSGQITFDANILSNLFNPDEPLASYFAASNNDFTNQKLQLELEASTSSGTDANHEEILDQPSLFELADIDEDNHFGDHSLPKSNDESVAELIDLDDDFSASLNTPLVHFEAAESPLLSQIRTGKKSNRK